MKARIALATVSGKAYYQLVKELKARGFLFLSLRPWDSVPLDIRAVITTEEESALVNHPNLLTFKQGDDPARVIDEAIRTIQGKQGYENVTVGIDPGKAFGVAVLGDGKVLQTINASDLNKTINAIMSAVQSTPASVYVVKVGDGAPIYTKELLLALDESLPENVVVEIVGEAGTSHFTQETSHRRGLRDAMSAIKIARRNGRVLQRGREHETDY